MIKHEIRVTASNKHGEVVFEESIKYEKWHDDIIQKVGWLVVNAIECDESETSTVQHFHR